MIVYRYTVDVVVSDRDGELMLDGDVILAVRKSSPSKLEHPNYYTLLKPEYHCLIPALEQMKHAIAEDVEKELS